MADIVTRTPFDVLKAATDVLDRLNTGLSPRVALVAGQASTLPVDVYEEAEQIVVEAAVPGFTADEIDLEWHQNMLSITATPAQQPAPRRYLRRERLQQVLRRSIRMPLAAADVEPSARLDDGVLRVTLQISPAAKPKRIAIS